MTVIARTLTQALPGLLALIFVLLSPRHPR